MNQTYINNLKNRIGAELILKDPLFNARSSGKVNMYV